MGTGAKVGIGCGIGCLGMILVVAVAGFIGWKWVDGKVNEFETDFAEKGLVDGGFSQMLDITTPPTQPTYYKGQMVKLNFTEPVTVDIGIIGQQIEIIQGQFNGNVYVRGQMVTVNPKVSIDGELNAICQMLDNRGATVKGGVKGQYQKME